jgi:hypothetical protein
LVDIVNYIEEIIRMEQVRPNSPEGNRE